MLIVNPSELVEVFRMGCLLLQIHNVYDLQGVIGEVRRLKSRAPFILVHAVPMFQLKANHCRSQYVVESLSSKL